MILLNIFPIDGSFPESTNVSNKKIQKVETEHFNSLSAESRAIMIDLMSVASLNILLYISLKVKHSNWSETIGFIHANSVCFEKRLIVASFRNQKQPKWLLLILI